MKELKVIKSKGQRVLTTKQIADEYGVKTVQISQNFANNRNKFVEGKHYISLTGDDLRAFKNQFEKIELVDSRTSHLYLWTEKGALLHAKSLNTDKAWKVYDYLVDFYFRVKEEKKETAVAAGKPVEASRMAVNVPDNPQILNAIKKIQNDLICMDVFLENLKRYSSKKAYYDNRKSAADVISIIVSDWNVLLLLDPKMIELQENF